MEKHSPCLIFNRDISFIHIFQCFKCVICNDGSELAFCVKHMHMRSIQNNVRQFSNDSFTYYTHHNAPNTNIQAI